MKDAEADRQLRTLIFWIIALGIGAVLLAALLARQNLAADFGNFTTRFLGIFIEAAPFLLLGTVASGLIEAFITRDDIARFIPRSPLMGTVTGVFMGFAFPVCECGVVPVTRRLFNKGLPMSVGVAFLLAAPVMNPVVVASTFTAFGFGPVLIGRFIVTAVVAMAVGLLFAYTARPQDVLLPQRLAPAMGGSGDLPLPQVQMPLAGGRKALLPGLLDATRTASYEFVEMGRYLVLGSMLAAAMQTFIPQSALEALGAGPVLSVLMAQIIAFILSVCSTVDSFLALALQQVGFSTGALISFLSFGPMVDIKSTLMFSSVFKRRVVLYLILLPFLMNLVIGVWINLNLGV